MKSNSGSCVLSQSRWAALRPLLKPHTAFATQRAIIEQQRHFAVSTPRFAQRTNGGRSFEELKESIVKDIRSMQQPSELFMNMAYCMTLNAAVAMAIEGGVFRRLAASSLPHTASELAKGLEMSSNSSDVSVEQVEFITRIMRGLCGFKLADETGPSTYQGNDLTEIFADPGFSQGFMFMFHNLFGPTSTLTQALLWAKENRFQAPTTAVDGAFQRARGAVGTSTFTYYNESDPKSMSQLSAWMQRIQQGRLNWSEWFPADVIFGTSRPTKDDIFMVDVGGGLGHDLNGFAARYPELEMKLVLQDQPSVIADAKRGALDPRIQLVEHDFFEPQPIKGAKIIIDQYFLHKIIHDWPDQECVKILSQLRDAMTADSRIFLNDAIIPEEGSPLLFSAFDFSMFALLSAKERSEAMWTHLIKAVGGLQIRKFWQAPGMQGEGIVEVVKT